MSLVKQSNLYLQLGSAQVECETVLQAIKYLNATIRTQKEKPETVWVYERGKDEEVIHHTRLKRQRGGKYGRG